MTNKLWRHRFVGCHKLKPAWVVVIAGRIGPKRKTLNAIITAMPAVATMSEEESWSVKSRALCDAWEFCDREFPGVVLGWNVMDDSDRKPNRRWTRAMMKEAFNL